MWWRKQRDCQHLHARGIYGDAIMANGWKRGYCPDCGHWMHQLPARAAVRTEPPGYRNANEAADNGNTRPVSEPEQ